MILTLNIPLYTQKESVVKPEMTRILNCRRPVPEIEEEPDHLLPPDPDARGI